MLIFGFYIAQSSKNPHVTLFEHCISKTARYSILSPLVKKSYLGDKLLNPEYQVIASRPFIYQQIQCALGLFGTFSRCVYTGYPTLGTYKSPHDLAYIQGVSRHWTPGVPGPL